MEQSKEQILRNGKHLFNDQVDSFGGEKFVRAIEGAMGEWADQEKRKEAIAFAEWSADHGWLIHPECDEDEERGWYKPSDDFDIPDERMYGGQLYDLYLQQTQNP